ncbi:hypothetical protein BVY01_04770 [bacterium I07]|nr:hypothetical protein BVY01_04770 [bacterium I07]
MLTLIFKLLFAHAMADFSLQTNAMAMGKNRNVDWEGAKQGGKRYAFWPYWLTAHALIHGGAVWVVTGNVLLGAVETLLHWLIDFAKCENWINIHFDQALHLVTKIAYVWFLLKA